MRIGLYLFLCIFTKVFSFGDIENASLSNWSNYGIIDHIVKILSVSLGQNTIFADSQDFAKPLLIPNRLLLYGPPGNGKTTLAYEIAKEARCQIVHIHAPSVVTKYAGSGAENIKREMVRAFDIMVESGRPVIIFIDEVDAIAILGADDSRVEDNKAMQELWLYLDKFKQDPRFFIICATNRYEKLSKAFISRFAEQQRLKIDKPNEEMRREILMNLVDKYEVVIDKNAIKNLAYYSDGMSIRELEDFVSQVKISVILLREPLIDKQLIKKIKLYPRSNGIEDSHVPKRDIYDKIHLASSLVAMASASTTVITFIVGLPYIKSILGTE